MIASLPVVVVHLLRRTREPEICEIENTCRVRPEQKMDPPNTMSGFISMTGSDETRVNFVVPHTDEPSLALSHPDVSSKPSGQGGISAIALPGIEAGDEGSGPAEIKILTQQDA